MVEFPAYDALISGGFTTLSPTLSLNNISKADGGRYTCWLVAYSGRRWKSWQLSSNYSDQLL